MTLAPNDQVLADNGKVLNLSNSKATKHNEDKNPKKVISFFWLSFAICILMPLGLLSFYYAAMATDRFAARAGFSIRGIDSGGGIDGIGALTGLASAGSTTSESYIVLSYLSSRTLLEGVDERLDLRGVFSQFDIDWASRLKQNVKVEEFVKYWNRKIHTQFDPTSGIIEFEVQSFSAVHSHDIANAVLDLTQKLVNDLSSTARRDALRFAREEVKLQETRLRQARTAIRDFRTSEQTVNPSASAALEIELIASLESRLIDVNTRVDALRQSLDENAPSLVALLRNSEAISAQIIERRAVIGSNPLEDTGVSAITQQLARYETLEVERSLAEQAYASSLASIEQARRDADRQQRYLAIHLRPQVAETAKYPRSLPNILIVAFALIASWGIGTLITYSVKDHLT